MRAIPPIDGDTYIYRVARNGLILAEADETKIPDSSDMTDNPSCCDTCGANLTDGSGDGVNGHWQNCTVPTTTTLTADDLQYLADLLRGVHASAKMDWYPYGTDSAANPASFVLRQFTTKDGMYWPNDQDIRDAYVWCSGMFERWLPVRDVMKALSNLNGDLGLTEPIAIIRHEKD
jgi:hypothetical protein